MFYTKWVLPEDEPLEDMLRRFDPDGRRSAMTTPPRVVKLGTSQVRQPPRMKSQVLKVEFITKLFAKKKNNVEIQTSNILILPTTIIN